MSIIQSISRREQGLRFVQEYDIALSRLKCYQEDVHKGIAPNINALDFNPSPPVFACRFTSTPGYEEIVALANEDGKIALQDTTVKRESDTPLEGIQAHDDAIFDIAWMPQEMKLVTASGDHSARLWDVSLSGIKELQTFEAHTRSIKNAVFRYQDKAVFATGARDGAIMIWDIRANHNNRPRPDNSIFNAHSTNLPNRARHRKTPSNLARQTHAQSITGLVFQDDYTLISCSTGDGLIKVWDLRKNYTAHKKDAVPKYVMHYGGKSSNNGFSSLLVCPAGIKLYANCMDSTIYVYNISTYNSKPIAEYYGHSNSTFYVKSCLSPDGIYLASGSSDELAYIWNTSKPGAPLLKLSGHREEVTCIAWCSVGQSKIITCSDDSCHRIWRVGKEHISDDERTNIQGFAEPVTSTPNNSVRIHTLETTPTLSRPRTSREYSSESDVTPINTPNLNNVEDTHNNTGSAKRSYYQMCNTYWSEGNYKKILSPIHENLEHSLKRPNIENRGARRLFSPGNKTGSLGIESNGYDSDEPTCSFKKFDSASILFSPTSNLPNFVIDGTAPHLVQMSPQKSKENIDWLTKMRKEKYAQRNCESTEKLSSPKNHATPARRASRSKSTESRRISKGPTSPLLQFFRSAAKNCDNTLHENSTNLAFSCSSSETT